MPRKVEDALQNLQEPLIEAAKKGKTSLKCGAWEHVEDDWLWVSGGYKKTDKYKEAVERLEKMGYSVKFYYKELKFVDMYTIISW